MANFVFLFVPQNTLPLDITPLMPTMELWLLRPAKNLHYNDNPWEPWYNKSFGFVVRAENEQEAREMANSEAGNENRGKFLGRKIAGTKTPWLDSRYSTCIKLTKKGKKGIIIEDFAAA